MALASQIVPVGFSQGLDRYQDPRQPVVPGRLQRLQNGTLETPGQIKKRNGHAQIAKASAGSVIAAFKNQMLVGDGASAQGYSGGTLTSKGVMESLALSSVPAARDTYPKQTCDVAIHSTGIAVYTFESVEGGTTLSRYSVFDTATGQPIVVNVLIPNAMKPKPIALGNYVVVLYYETSSTHLRFVAIPALSPTSPLVAADLVLDPSTDQAFDAAVIGTQIVVAYKNNGAANRLTVTTLSAALAVGAKTTPTLADAISLVSVFGDASNNAWVAYYTGTAIKALVYESTITTLSLAATSVDALPGTVRNLAGIVSGSTATLLYEASGSSAWFNRVNTATLTLAGAVSGVGVWVRSVGLASKPFLYNGRVHALVTHSSAFQSTYFLVAGGTVVGKLATGTGGGLTVKSMLPEVCSVATGVYSFAFLQTDEIGAQSGKVFSQAGVQGGTADFTARPSVQEASDNLHVSGGILYQYDGAQACEHGFHLYPENIVTATAAGALTGTYQYVVTYEWMDAQGLIHQSAPSSPASIVLAAQGCQLTIPTLCLTAKTTPVSIVVWRTGAAGTVFYRLTSISAPLLNVTTADTVTYTDAATDASIIGNAQIYSNPLNTAAELAAMPADSPSFVWRYRNRVFYVPAESASQVHHSKAVVPGLPVEFNPAQLYIPIEQEGGGVTCGIEMDDKCVLFKKSRIYVFAGDGPAPNGTGSDYGQPLHVTADVGCVNPRSLALIPQGVIFQSAKGIYLLTRGLAVEYVGDRVEPWGTTTITSAVVVPNAREVRLSLSTGIVLVYNTRHNQWSVNTGLNLASACVFGGLYTFVQPNGIVQQETPGAFTDNGTPILLGITTSWLSFAGLSGFQRVRHVLIRGDYRSDHRLSVSVGTDDNPGAPQQAVLNPTSILVPGALAGTTYMADRETPGGGAYPHYEFDIHVKNQRCTNIQIAIDESQPGPTYAEGLSLSGIAFEVGLKPGRHRIPAVQTA